MLYIRRFAFAAVAGLLFLARADCALADPAATPAGTFTLVLENDLFGGGADRHYTHGTRFAWLSPEGHVPDIVKYGARQVPLFAADGKLRTSYSLGQNIYTPSDIRVAEVMPDDRPYAGWLYGSVGLVSDNGERLDNLELSVGVVGPWALAGQTQDFVHKYTNSPDPQGWDHQLKNEVGVVLTYERQWRSWHKFDFLGLEGDMTPRLGGSVGNVYTHLAAGGTLRIGHELPADYGPPRIRPSLPGSDFFLPTDGFGWYLFAGAEARVVGRNIFLDGNTFTDSHSVGKKYLVGDIQFGIAATYGPARIAYTHIIRTSEFHGQGTIDRFGAMSMSLQF